MVPRLRECFRQGQAEVVSNSKNKILATWEPFFCRTLYMNKNGKPTDLAVRAIKGGEAGEALRDGRHGLGHHRDDHLAVLVLRRRVLALGAP